MLSLYEIRDSLKAYKNKKLHKLVTFLNKKKGLTSNMISIAGLICGITAAFFLFQNHSLYIVFILLAIALDIFDGALAKIENKKDEGWIVDITCDRTVMLSILLAYGFYLGFDTIIFIVAIFLLVNIFLVYERLVLGRKLKMFHFDSIAQILLIFQFYEIGLTLLAFSSILNLALMFGQLYEADKKS